MSQVCKITEPLCNITLQQEKNWAPEEAQKAAELLLENKLISLSEFDKLTELNRKTFYPYLSELMPKIA